MKPAIKIFFRSLLIFFALTAGLVLFGAVPINAGFARAPIENAVRDATGLNFSISGPIKLRLGAKPEFSSGNLELGETASGRLLGVRSLSAKVGLFPLLSGRIHLHELQAEGIEIDYCSDLPAASPQPAKDAGPPPIVVDAIDLRNITIHCNLAQQSRKPTISILAMLGSAPEGGRIHLQVDGSLSGVGFTLSGSGGELNALLVGEKPFPLDLSLRTAYADIEVSGSLHTLQTNPAVKLQFDVLSDNVQALLSSFGIAAPALGSLKAKGLIHADTEIVELSQFSGELGESRIELDAGAELDGERVHLEVIATLAQLDLNPFLIHEQTPLSRDPSTGRDDIDLTPVLDALNIFDADLQLSVEQVLGIPLDIRDVAASAKLADGAILIGPLVAALLGGHVTLDGSFDSQSDCPLLNLLARGNGLDLEKLNPLLALDTPIRGSTDEVELRIASCGYSLFAHRDTLRAEFDLKEAHISLGESQLPITAEQLQMNIAYDERGHARLVSELANERVEATLDVGSLAMLLGPDTWPIAVYVQGAGAEMRMEGRAGIMPGQLTLDALVEFEAPTIGSLHRWTEGPPDATLPFQAKTRLRFDESSFTADEIALSLGESDLTGSVIWKHAEDPDTLALSLRSSSLDLDEINAAIVGTADEPAFVEHTAAQDDIPMQQDEFTLPPVDLDLKFAALNIAKFHFQDLEVSGRLRAGLIDTARVSVILEKEVLLRGELDLDTRSSPSRGVLTAGAENINVGRLLDKLDVADDLQLKAEVLELAVTSEGATPIQFLLNAVLEVDMQGFNWFIPRANSAGAVTSHNGLEVNFERVRLSTESSQGTVWEALGESGGVPLEFRIETPSLQETFGDAPMLPLKLVAAVGNNVAMFEARIDLVAEADFLADVVLSGAVIERDTRKLADLHSPLPDYEVRGEVSLNANELTLPNVQMRLGSSKANGSFTLSTSGERQRTEIMLHAPYLQTDDLLYWGKMLGESESSGRQVDDERETEAPEDNEENAESGFFFMLRDYIAKFRKNSDLDLSITVDELHAGADLLGGAELALVIDETEFALKPLHIFLPGGDLVAEYTSKIADGRLNAALKFHAEALRYGGLLHLADPESQAQGVLYLDTDISADTEWTPGTLAFKGLLKNANGSFGFAVWPENAEAGILDIWTANLVLALLPKPTAGQSSLLNCLVARLDVENGVLQTGKALLDSTDTIIRGRGKIDMAQEELELLVAPQAKREKFLSMSTPVMVTGPFDNFQIGVEPGGMFATAMKLWMSLVYVPFKWLTGERFPADGTATCFKVMEWELTPELHDYFLKRDFSAPLPTAP